MITQLNTLKMETLIMEMKDQHQTENGQLTEEELEFLELYRNAPDEQKRLALLRLRGIEAN
jgi:hypothetical protein